MNSSSKLKYGVLISTFFGAGCVSNSPLETALSLDNIDYANIVQLVDTDVNHRFEVSDKVFEINLNKVFELVNLNNYSILAAKEESERAQAQYSREHWTELNPRFYADGGVNWIDKEFKESIINARVGAKLLLPGNADLDIFLQNEFLEQSLDKENRTHSFGIQLIVPVPFLHPAANLEREKDFRDYVKLMRSKNRYQSQVREVLNGALKLYAGALKYKSRVILQNEGVERLESLRSDIKDEQELSQLGILITEEENERDRLQGKYQNKVAGLQNYLGIPLEQKVNVVGELGFENNSNRGDVMSKVLSADYNLRDLVLNLKQAYLTKKTGDEDYFVRPNLFFAYNREFNGQDDFSAGLSIEIPFGPTTKKEGRAAMLSFKYQIRERKQALELQTTSLIRDLQVNSQQLPIALRTLPRSVKVLGKSEQNLRNGDLSFSDFRPDYLNWKKAKDNIISTRADGMEQMYNLRGLLGELEK